MTTVDPSPLSFKQQFILGAGVPAIFFLLLELAARCVTALSPSPEPNQPMQLEMPTWMMQDANAFSREAPTADALEWLNLFEQGQGYRVRLKPLVSLAVKNTFSLIPSERNRRYLISSNSLGFRSPDTPLARNENSFRIAVFGDSSSFGWGVNVEDSWTYLLQKKLQERLPRRTIELMNFAIPGDSSAYGSLLFDAFAPRAKPDLVILGFGANDAKAVFTSHTSQVSRFKETSRLQGLVTLLRYSALYRALETLAQKTQKSANTDRPRVPAVSLPDYASNLSRMASEARDLGAQNTLLLTLCTPNNYAGRARSVARKQHLLWFNGQRNLLQAVPRIMNGELYPEYVRSMKQRYPEELERNSLFYVTSDGCHPNELGHRFIADSLTELVIAGVTM